MDVKKKLGSISIDPTTLSEAAMDQLSHLAMEFETTVNDAAMVAIHVTYLQWLDGKRAQTSRAIDILLGNELDDEIPF
ncbi:MAG: hypothetical protein AAF367_19400 [Pseudomonadota bacterium]